MLPKRDRVRLALNKEHALLARIETVKAERHDRRRCLPFASWLPEVLRVAVERHAPTAARVLTCFRLVRDHDVVAVRPLSVVDAEIFKQLLVKTLCFGELSDRKTFGRRLLDALPSLRGRVAVANDRLEHQLV